MFGINWYKNSLKGLNFEIEKVLRSFYFKKKFDVSKIDFSGIKLA